MDFGVTFQTDPPAWRVVELTKRAEQLGFTHAWTFDSHIVWQEPYVVTRKCFLRRRGSW
jgi:alkanesulfonate monooxygenase SsuD/methylene tetrahydromethanopterin reductase-like flavin-dependent oxidoreductase (luciferase family)